MQTKITEKEHVFFLFEDVVSQNVGTGHAFPHDLCLIFRLGRKLYEQGERSTGKFNKNLRRETNKENKLSCSTVLRPKMCACANDSAFVLVATKQNHKLRKSTTTTLTTTSITTLSTISSTTIFC